MDAVEERQQVDPADGWVVTTLAEVCNFNPRSTDRVPADEELVTFVPMAAVDAELGQITQAEIRAARGLKRGYTRFQNGDVLFAKITPCMENGKAAVASDLAGGIGFGSTEFHVFRPGPEIMPEWIYYFVRQQWFRDMARDNFSGTAGQRRVPTSFLEHTEIPLPPLEEQRRIVGVLKGVLGEIREAREALARVPGNVKRFRRAVLAAAFRGHLTAEWRDQNAPKIQAAAEACDKLTASTPPNSPTASDVLEYIPGDRLLVHFHGTGTLGQLYDGDLEDLPESWTWAKASALAALEPRAITDGPFGSNLKTEHYVENGPRVIRLQNIGDGVFNDVHSHISDQHFETLRRHEVFAGDIVIGALGDPLPRACLIPPVGLAIVKADCIRLKPNAAMVCSAYVCFAINSDQTRSWAIAQVHGVGRTRLNLENIRRMPVPLAPIAEQREIVRRIEEAFAEADSAEASAATATEYLRRLEQSTLQSAFRGEL